MGRFGKWRVHIKREKRRGLLYEICPRRYCSKRKCYKLVPPSSSCSVCDQSFFILFNGIIPDSGSVCSPRNILFHQNFITSKAKPSTLDFSNNGDSSPLQGGRGSRKCSGEMTFFLPKHNYRAFGKVLHSAISHYSC
jgi:hypothetical protein